MQKWIFTIFVILLLENVQTRIVNPEERAIIKTVLNNTILKIRPRSTLLACKITHTDTNDILTGTVTHDSGHVICHENKSRFYFFGDDLFPSRIAEPVYINGRDSTRVELQISYTLMYHSRRVFDEYGYFQQENQLFHNRYVKDYIQCKWPQQSEHVTISHSLNFIILYFNETGYPLELRNQVPQSEFWETDVEGLEITNDSNKIYEELEECLNTDFIKEFVQSAFIEKKYLQNIIKLGYLGTTSHVTDDLLYNNISTVFFICLISFLFLVHIISVIINYNILNKRRTLTREEHCTVKCFLNSTTLHEMCAFFNALCYVFDEQLFVIKHICYDKQCKKQMDEKIDYIYITDDNKFFYDNNEHIKEKRGQIDSTYNVPDNTLF